MEQHQKTEIGLRCVVIPLILGKIELPGMPAVKRHQPQQSHCYGLTQNPVAETMTKDNIFKQGN
jgi:hypothetical protein